MILEKETGEQDDLRSRWMDFDSHCWDGQLNASRMLQRGGGGDGEETVGEFVWLHVQPVDQADRQAGNMQCTHGLVGVRT